VKESLFRQAAVAQDSGQLWGELFLEQPLKLKVMALIIAMVTVAALFLLAMGEYERKVAVSGALVPEQGLVTLSAPANATIAELLVNPGDQIIAGQPLIRLSFDGAGATVSTGLQLIRAVQLQQAALSAERQDELAKGDAIDREFALQNRQLKAHRTDLQLMSRQVLSLVDLRSNALERARQLVDRGSLAPADLDAVRSALLEQQGRLHELEMEIRQLDYDLQVLGNDTALAKLNNHQALARLDTRNAELQQTLLRTEQEQGTLISAPLSGKVSASALSPGMSVAAGSALLSIVPLASALQAELEVPSSAIGFLHPGQQVTLRLDAFPYQKFGVLAAHVHEVAGSASVHPAAFAGRSEAVYRVTAILSRQNITAYGQPRELLAGMALQADVTLDTRSLLEWLLEPLFSIKGRRA